VKPAAEAASKAEAGADEKRPRYAPGARILSLGIASTGLVTFAYFSLASYSLSPDDYADIVLVWSVMFVILSVIYRPVEQLLSRTIATRRARGMEGADLRVPMILQGGFALVFLIVALILRPQIQDAFGGSAVLYWVLVTAVVLYAASYFLRGWLAGHQLFALYGGLVLLESISRTMFALVAVVGLVTGQSVVALGMAAAPLVSLLVFPGAVAAHHRARQDAKAKADARADRVADDGLIHEPEYAAEIDAAYAGPAAEGAEEASHEMSLKKGGGFAGGVLGVMLAEQALLNGAVVAIAVISPEAALAGFVFNVFLITRAPLQLFQAIQTSLLPHLSRLEATASRADFDHAIRVTVLAIAGFAGLAAVCLAAVGPPVMDLLFDSDFTYERGGLVLMAVAMGLHLTAGTLNQAALARGQAGWAAAAWLFVAALFLGFVVSPIIGDEVLRVQAGYAGATLILCALLFALYRRPAGTPDP
jgi:O-antigen/teichoic acid export membrane protein